MVAAMLLLGLIVDVGAWSPSGLAGFPMGNTNGVENYCAKECYVLEVFAYQYTPLGMTYVGWYISSGTLDFNYKADFDSFFQQKLQFVAEMAATNKNGDPTQPYYYYAFASGYNPATQSDLNYLGVNSTMFNLMNVNGVYRPPDLTTQKLNLLSEIAYQVPGMGWGRVEVTMTNGIKVVYDPKVSAGDSNVVSLRDKAFFIPKNYALSGTNGGSRIKISLISSNNFRVIGSMGNQISENSLLIDSFKLTNTPTKTVSFKILGGEVGRVLQVSSSSTSAGPWVNIPGIYTVTPSSTGGISFSSSAPMTNQFYRVHTVDPAPVPTY